MSSYQNACNKELDWIRTIHTLLARNGLQYRISDGSSDVCNALLGKTKDIFHQEAFAQVADPKSKLRTYGLIKENIGREDYLDQIRNTKHRQMLTKLRLSNHKLMIEKGRHLKLEPNERICPVCQQGVEDEIHFLVQCNQYQNHRNPLLDICLKTRPQFEFYTDEHKFVFMMTTPSLMGNVSKFVYTAMNERDTYLDVRETLDKLMDQVSKSMLQS